MEYYSGSAKTGWACSCCHSEKLVFVPGMLPLQDSHELPNIQPTISPSLQLRVGIQTEK